jgi:hypothetical protein
MLLNNVDAWCRARLICSHPHVRALAGGLCPLCGLPGLDDPKLVAYVQDLVCARSNVVFDYSTRCLELRRKQVCIFRAVLPVPVPSASTSKCVDTSTHRALIQIFESAGFQTRGFRQQAIRVFHPDGPDALTRREAMEETEAFRLVPDAFLFLTNIRVLVVVEVDVHHHPSPHKYRDVEEYLNDLGWDLYELHVDRHGAIIQPQHPVNNWLVNNVVQAKHG